jgi:predicted membrane protein
MLHQPDHQAPESDQVVFGGMVRPIRSRVSAHNVFTIMSTSWLLEEDILIFILLIALTWFGAIIYFIPLRLYLDQKAATAAQRPAAQRSGDPKLIGMQYW